MNKGNEDFRFAIMGAGGIANRFCDAVKLLEGCCVAAVASKSMERAKDFASRNHVRKYYDSYLEMLIEERPDCVYIATTTDAHYELSRLCLENGVPVLCEKAMFVNAAQAKDIFTLSREKQLFAMEAMWSRFLPAVRQAKAWVADGSIGAPVFGDIKIGFAAPADPANRYFNPELGGGAAYDITVYGYEIMTYMLERSVEMVKAEAVLGETGVDVTDSVLMRFAPDVLAACMTTILTSPDEKLVFYGTEGKVVLPHPHYASEAFLYDNAGNCVQHFVDDVTQNGFTYEIEEAMSCIRAGKTESEVVPHSLTLACAELFDRMLLTAE